MPTDALIALQVSTTQIATFSGVALVLPGGTPRRGLKARVLYSAADTTAGTETVTFGIGVSHDGGVTFPIEAQADPITLSTTAQSGKLDIPFEVSPTSVVNGVQIKLIATFGGTGTSPTITYQGDIELARP